MSLILATCLATCYVDPAVHRGTQYCIYQYLWWSITSLCWSSHMMSMLHTRSYALTIMLYHWCIHTLLATKLIRYFVLSVVMMHALAMPVYIHCSPLLGYALRQCHPHCPMMYIQRTAPAHDMWSPHQPCLHCSTAPTSTCDRYDPHVTSCMPVQ